MYTLNYNEHIITKQFFFFLFFFGEIQQPAVWASAAHGCRPCRAAKGAPDTDCPTECWVVGGAKPLLIASACRESIKRFAAWRSASRSSAVCRLKIKKEKILNISLQLPMYWVNLRVEVVML